MRSGTELCQFLRIVSSYSFKVILLCDCLYICVAKSFLCENLNDDTLTSLSNLSVASKMVAKYTFPLLPAGTVELQWLEH